MPKKRGKNFFLSRKRNLLPGELSHRNCVVYFLHIHLSILTPEIPGNPKWVAGTLGRLPQLDFLIFFDALFMLDSINHKKNWGHLFHCILNFFVITTCNRSLQHHSRQVLIMKL
jgi:hypothetical protein